MRLVIYFGPPLLMVFWLFFYERPLLPSAQRRALCICPANWRLPLSSSTYKETPGSFYSLLNQYGLTSSPTSGNNNINTSPLYFVRSGYVDPDGSRLYRAGYYGDYWSGRANSSSSAYVLYFHSSRVYPSNNAYRYYGQSVRCVAGWE